MTTRLICLLVYSAAASQCASFITKQCAFLFANASCTFTKCASLPITNVTPLTISENWDTCTNQCCSSYNVPSHSNIIDSLALYCSVQPDKKYSIALTVGVAIGFIVFVLLVVLCCMYYNFMSCICPCLVVNNRGQMLQAPSQLQIAQPSRKREEVLVTQELFDEHVSVHLCSICLDGDTDLTTKCGHHFHLQCLMEWLKKRNSCPECRTEEIGDFAIFCSKCLKNYLKTNQVPLEGTYLCRYCKL